MGDIYHSAERIVVWLGREFHDQYDTTEDVLRGTWRLQYAREDGRIPPGILEQLIHDPEAALESSQTSKIRLAAVDWLNTQGREKIDNWILGLPLFRRTWFTRAWILQEVFMAKDITVACGPYVLPWDIFIFMSTIIEACRLACLDSRFNDLFGTARIRCSAGYARATILSGGKSNMSKVPAIDLERQGKLSSEKGTCLWYPLYS
jgi:hypothetical protein